MAAAPADGRMAPTAAQQDGQRLRRAAQPLEQGGRKVILRARYDAEFQLLRLQHVLVLRGTEIEVVFIDIGLDDRVDEHGDVDVLIDGFADARGADAFEL